MKPMTRALVLFVVMTIVGYLAIAGGWITYAIVTDYFDREGSTGMGVIFVIAPMGGVTIGTICAGASIAWRKQRR